MQGTGWNINWIQEEYHQWKSWLKTQHSETKNMASGPITSWQIDVETVETVAGFIVMGSQITADRDCSHEIKRCLLLGRKVMTNLGSMLKSRDITLSTKFHLVKAMVFPVVTCGCENWTIKTAELWRINAFELWCLKGLESPLDWKEIQPVLTTGNQSWVFIGRTHVEAEIPVLWPSDGKNWLFWKDPDAGKDWGQEKGMTEDEMVGWHHRLDGHGFGWTPGVGDGQGGLVRCSSWGCKESDMTEWLNWTELKTSNRELVADPRWSLENVKIYQWRQISSKQLSLLRAAGQDTQDFYGCCFLSTLSKTGS